MSVAVRAKLRGAVSVPLLRVHARRVLHACNLAGHQENEFWGHVQISLVPPRQMAQLNSVAREHAVGTTDVLSFGTGFVAPQLRADREFMAREAKERADRAQEVADMAAEVFGYDVGVEFGGPGEKHSRPRSKTKAEGYTDVDLDQDVEIDDAISPGDVWQEQDEETGQNHVNLGQIVIDPRRVQRDAKRVGLELNVGYIPIILAHGVCHLIGYDHERSPVDSDLMEAEEIRILEQVRKWQREHLPEAFRADIPEEARPLGKFA